MIDLLPSQQRVIISKLSQALEPGVELFAFGSRTRSDARRFSDLDLLLKSAKPIRYAQLAEAQELLAESDLPFNVDLVDDARISDRFRERISSELVAFGVTGTDEGA